MTRIIAAIFDDTAAADYAETDLRAAGFPADAIDRFMLNAAGQHHGLPLGGDQTADAGASGGGKGALTGVALGGLVGAAAGAAAATVLGPVAIAGGLAAGAYAGSLAGAAGSMGKPPVTRVPTEDERPAGVMVAVNVGAERDEDIALDALRHAGARMLEWARGEWRDGHWADFDPVAPPQRVEYPIALQRVASDVRVTE
jgi:hypothetical protein